MKFVFAVVLLLQTVLPATARATPLPPALAQAFAQAGIPISASAIDIREAGTGQPVLSVNHDRPMNPASTMKLLTSFAALELLGPAYTWKTEFFLTDDPVEGRIGHLYLRGGGDPKLTLEQFWRLLRQLRARGVREIQGDLVVDKSLFRLTPGEERPLDDKPLRPYNVGPDALLLNFRTVQLTLTPAVQGGTVAVMAEPLIQGLEIDNRLRANGGDCLNWKDGLRADLNRSGNAYRLTLNGTLPVACGEKAWHLGVLPPDDYLLGVFRQLWAELGGRFQGGLRADPVPEGARPVARHESATLAEIVRDINKFSNNVMARQLYLSLGLAEPTDAANPSQTGLLQAEASLRRWLEKRGLVFPELVLENGSGLSRRESISAAHLAQVLHIAHASPLMPEFIASLPLVAVDGTMKKRLNGKGIAGQAHLKTGTLDGVKAVAGYIQTKSGKTLIAVCLINHPKAEAAQGAMDALLQWAYEQ